jgi:hypothetical protein
MPGFVLKPSILLITLAVLISGSPAPGEEFLDQVEAERSRAPWRGSEFVYRNVFSALSLDPSAELTYNPSFAMSFSFRPSWWFSDQLYVRANLDLVREITEADDTTYADETLLGDLVLTAGYAPVVTIPVVDISVSADISLQVPTSKVSQARTLALGIGPGVRLARSFDLLSGLSVGYSLRAIPLIHQNTTAELETPLIPGCSASGGGCDAYLHTGVRNTQFRLQQLFYASARMLDWLSLSVTYGLWIDWLYPIDTGDPRISAQTIEPQDRRYASVWEVEVLFSPMPALKIGVGTSTLGPQLAPDSSYYNPFYNRYTTVFVDLHLDVAGLVSQITH